MYHLLQNLTTDYLQNTQLVVLRNRPSLSKCTESLLVQTALWRVILLIMTPLNVEQGFFPRGTGGPPVGENLVNPPHPALLPIFRPEPVPLHPTFVPKIFYNFSTFLYRF